MPGICICSDGQLSDFSCQISVVKLPLLGSIGKLQRPEGKLDFKKLDEFAQKHKLAALYIEPSLDAQDLPTQAGTILDTRYTKSHASFLPSKTIQIDLTRTEEEIFDQIKKKTRYEIRFAQKNSVLVAQSRDDNLFAEMWQKSAWRRGMWLPQKKEIRTLWNAFQGKAYIIFTYKTTNLNPVVRSDTPVYQKKPIAGVLVVRSRGAAYYTYAFSTEEGNKLSAPTLLVWEAIKFARNEKCKMFDFEGIYDERYPQTKNWKGFTKFKEGFGGKTVVYPQSLVRYYSPLAKLLNL